MELTLVTVNWNQRKACELMLKSFLRHHYLDEPVKLLLVDNASTDDSKPWLHKNEIPFVDNSTNIGHENAVNQVWDRVQTRYCLLLDTDIYFDGYIVEHGDNIRNECVAAGEFILNEGIMPRLSPWFLLFDMWKVRDAGIDLFRDPSNVNHAYDVGSEFYEKITKAGFTYHNIPREPGNQDADLISMKYKNFWHIGKCSWDLNQHGDRIDEVTRRRQWIEQKLTEFEDIDLKHKFI